MGAYAILLIIAALSNVASCGYLRKPPAHQDIPRPAHDNASNAIGFPELPVPANCTPPAGVIAETKRKGLALLSSSSSHAIFGGGDGPDISIFAYDCLRAKKILFAHIPKNAGTTVEELGAKSSVEWGMNDLEGKQRMPDGNDCSTWHVPPAQLVGDNPYEDPSVEVFCITRDPWERLLSEYLFDLSTAHKWPKKYIHDGPKCTVRGLNKFLVGSLTDVMNGHQWINDCHFIPQWDFIEGKQGRKWCHHVLDINDLTRDFNSLMIEYGLRVRMTKHDKVNSAAWYCPILEAASEVNLGSLFTQQTKDIVRKVYARDFEHLSDKLA